MVAAEWNVASMTTAATTKVATAPEVATATEAAAALCANGAARQNSCYRSLRDRSFGGSRNSYCSADFAVRDVERARQEIRAHAAWTQRALAQYTRLSTRWGPNDVPCGRAKQQDVPSTANQRLGDLEV